MSSPAITGGTTSCPSPGSIPQTRTITLAANASFSIRPGDRYYVQNLFEELDAPGEWYLDRQTSTLYFWPPALLKGKKVYAPTMRTLIELSPSTAHITIRGMTLECCDGTAVVLNHADDCLVAGNTIRNVGDYRGSGVQVRGGKRNGVVGNDIYEIGRDAIALSGGGDRITLTPAGNFADNNYIHHTGVYYKQGVGISLSGVGNSATHNLIHDCPRFGIGFSGNNIRIEYNHIRHVDLETADTGAIYTGGRDWISPRGSRIAYNYFHDILGYGKENGRWVSPHYAWGIYLDDNAGGVDVIGNIVARAVRGPIHLHNGRDNLVENNVFVDGTMQQVEYTGWTSSHHYWKRFQSQMIRNYDAVVNQPAWHKMRNMNIDPRNAVLPDDTIMSGNVVRRNIFYYHRPEAALFKLSNVSLQQNTFDDNLVYHFGQPLRIDWHTRAASGKAGKRPPHDTPSNAWPKWWQAAGEDRHSIVADPLFVDPDKDDYRLRPESPALKLGFKPIPVEKIGPYKDELRPVGQSSRPKGPAKSRSIRDNRPALDVRLHGGDPLGLARFTRRRRWGCRP